MHSPSNATFAACGESGSHPGDQEFRHVRDVGLGKPKQVVPGPEKVVLPAVVGHQGVSMLAAVVLDGEPAVTVVEIDSPEESPALVIEIDLRFRAGQAGKDEQKTEPCF